MSNNSLSDIIFDGRSKILPCQRERMIIMRSAGVSYGILSKMFRISKSEIYYICNPDKCKDKRKYTNFRKQKVRYYTKEKIRENTASSRANKKKIKSLFIDL